MFKSSARNSNRLEPKNQRVQNRIKNVIPFKKIKKKSLSKLYWKNKIYIQLYKKQNPMAASNL